MIYPTNGIIIKGSKIDFSWTWYENIKKVREIAVKPITIDFLVGFNESDNIEGILRTRLDTAHKTTRVDLLKCFSHCIIVSVMHQKLPTFNWYNPLCTGNIAPRTSFIF